MPVLYSNSRIFVIPVYIFNGRKQTLVDTIRILSALRMHDLHDKRHLLAKLRIAGSENLHSYTHAYCSYALLNEAIPIVSGSHCAHALLIWLFGFSIRFTGKKIQRVENSILLPKWHPNSSAPQNNVPHGELHVANKELNITICKM